ncbi:substrate-binding domain-containing protein [Streptomyces sp. NPDC005345]|uniref:substrate-binding domain-containing protein n=1 Tax=Streptomyces sp. NPDC005345 TaxID=3156877 RepID=UPI0033BD03ED
MISSLRWTPSTGSTERARPERPDALLCLNDHLALGAVRALHDRGLRVPDDIDVVGFDDIEASRYSIPTITTVAPDKEGIAGAAVDLLLDRIERPDMGTGSAEHVAGHQLIVRESSGG